MRITVPTYRPTAVCSRFTAHRSQAEIFAFSAKERDAETGLSYFGARYYSSDLSIWLSVDPMSDKYPSLSPYVYCADNPVRCVDPNGEEISSPDGWIVDNTNKTLTWVNNEGGDMFQYVSGKLESFKSKKDFVSKYAAKGYKINSGDATKTLGDATFAAYSGLQKGWNVHLKSRKMYFLKIDKSSFFRIKRKRTLGKI